MKTIEKKYKIKEKYTHLVNNPEQEYTKTGGTYFQALIKGCVKPVSYTDEMMEEIDQRIGVKILSFGEGCTSRKGLFLYGVHPTEEQRILCEKTLNGEMIDISDMQKMVSDWHLLHSRKLTFSEYLKKIGH